MRELAFRVGLLVICLAGCSSSVVGAVDMDPVAPGPRDARFLAELPDAQWPPCSASSGPQALVDGVIPTGPFSGRWAYLSFLTGDGGSLPNVWISDGPMLQPDAGARDGGYSRFAGHFIQFVPYEPGIDVGEGVARVDSAAGISQVFHRSDRLGYFEGIFAVDAPGWHLSGWYCAPHQPELDSFCGGPCQ